MGVSQSIVIAGLDVVIRTEPIEASEGEMLFGMWQQGPIPTITINSSCTEAIQRRTLLHEVLEAINDLYGIGLQEEQICAIETGLADTIIRNPAFLPLVSGIEPR